MISEIVLYNRVDDCCRDRLGPVDVYVDDGGTEKLCGSHTCDTGQIDVLPILCDSDVIGDKLRVVLPGSERILSLCEVEAYGTEIVTIV